MSTINHPCNLLDPNDTSNFFCNLLQMVSCWGVNVLIVQLVVACQNVTNVYLQIVDAPTPTNWVMSSSRVSCVSLQGTSLIALHMGSGNLVQYVDLIMYWETYVTKLQMQRAYFDNIDEISCPTFLVYKIERFLMTLEYVNYLGLTHLQPSDFIFLIVQKDHNDRQHMLKQRSFHVLKKPSEYGKTREIGITWGLGTYNNLVQNIT